MGRHSHTFSSHSGAVTYWLSNCASQHCYSWNRRWMWRSSWVTYSACVLHWPAERCDRLKACSLGCRKIPNRRTPDTHQRYCIVPYSCHDQWTARKAVPLRAHKPPNIYSNAWDEPRHRRILIWQRPLDLPWDLLHSICYCICCRCRILLNASLKIKTI